MPHTPTSPDPTTTPVSPGDDEFLIEGDVDVDTVSDIFDALVQRIHAAERTLHLDLTRVTFFDSHAISAIIRARKLAETRRVELIIDPSPLVLRILENVGLGDQFRWKSQSDIEPD